MTLLKSERRIGALVVTDAAGSLQGILSERDGARTASSGGATLLLSVVGIDDPQGRDQPDERIIQVLQKMTDGRFMSWPLPMAR